MGVGGISKFLDGFMDADVEERDRILKLMKETAGIGESTARRSETLSQIELREAAGQREQQLFPSVKRTAEAGATTAETTAATGVRQEKKAVEVDELVLKELGKSRELLEAILLGRQAKEGIGVLEARETESIAPQIARKDVAETKLGAARAEGELEQLPAQQRVEKQMLEMQPVGASLALQVKSQQIQTAIAERDPKVRLLNSQVGYYEGLAAKAQNANEKANYSNLTAMYKLAELVQANEYAKKVHGKSIEQLKVDEMVKEATLTDQQIISIYLSAIDKQARLADPAMLAIMAALGIDADSANVAATDLAAFAEKLLPEFEAAIERLKSQRLAVEPVVPPPGTGDVLGPPPSEGAIVLPTGETGTKRPSPEQERAIIEAGRRILPGGGTP